MPTNFLEEESFTSSPTFEQQSLLSTRNCYRFIPLGWQASLTHQYSLSLSEGQKSPRQQKTGMPALMLLLQRFVTLGKHFPTSRPVSSSVKCQ